MKFIHISLLMSSFIHSTRSFNLVGVGLSSSRLFSKKSNSLSSGGGLGSGLGSGLGGGSSGGVHGEKIRNIAPQYKPKTPNQEQYLQYLNDKSSHIVLGVGPAGSGKTLFACVTAVKELIAGNVHKIILTRPMVSVEEEEIGFLPGNLINKMEPWTRPIFDILLEHYQQKDLNLMLSSGVIEISPLAYMRGRTFKKCFIIADEMQNSTPNQMLMLTTRLGDKTKLVITGDLKQSDRSVSNGLIDIMNKVKFYNNIVDCSSQSIRIIEMNHADVKRSEIVSHVLDIYNVVEGSGGDGDDADDVDEEENKGKNTAGCCANCSGGGDCLSNDAVVEKEKTEYKHLEKPPTVLYAKKERNDDSFLRDCAL